MGASRQQVQWHVVLKAALSEILTGTRVSIAFDMTMRRIEPVLAPWKSKV